MKVKKSLKFLLTIFFICVHQYTFAFANTITVYSGKKAKTSELTVKKQYAIAQTDLDTEVFYELPSSGLVTVDEAKKSGESGYGKRSPSNSSGWKLTVDKAGPGFDKCSKGDIVDYDASDSSWGVTALEEL